MLRSAISAIELFFSGFRRDMRGDEKTYQPDDDDGEPVAMQKKDPRLAERHDAEDHDIHRDRFQIFRVDGAKAHRLPPVAFLHVPHLRMAPKVTPLSRWLRSTKVKIATGSKNSTVPAAITVQSGRPEPTWLGMKGGAVCASRFVRISAKAYSFQATIKENTAVAAIPVAASGRTDRKSVV